MLPVAGLVMGIIAIIFGILVLARPRILAYIVGIYFILVGVVAVIASL